MTQSVGMGILESPHAIEIILYVAEHDGCRKMDVYEDVSHNSTMSRKIDSLENAGILTQEPMNRGMVLRLTEKGRRVAEHLDAIRTIFSITPEVPAEEAEGGDS